MTILVTGGAGYIGSHMVYALRDMKRPVVVIDNLSTGRASVLPAGVPLVEGDIGDSELVGNTIRRHDVSAIIHFAGSIVVPDSVTDPLGYYLNNTVKSRALIETAVEHGVNHFIFSSTAAVYGMPEVVPVNEDAPLNPISPYGASKMMTEMMLSDVAHAHDFRFAALRYFNVAGGDPKGRTGQSTPRATHLIKVACQAALGQRTHMEIFGTDYDTPDGTGVRDYIHVSDLAKAHAAALSHLEQGGESLICNCGYGRGFSVREVIDIVKKVSGVDFEVRLSPRRAGDPAALVANVSKIHTLLDWKPALDDLETIVTHAYAWEKRLVEEAASNKAA